MTFFGKLIDDFFETKLCTFAATCFWHYCLFLIAALIWIFGANGKKNRLLVLFAVGFFSAFALRMLLRMHSSRYMFNAVLLALPIIAAVVVALYDRCRRSRVGICLFVLVAVMATACSCMKFARRGKDGNRRDKMVLRCAEIIRKDFNASTASEILLVSNEDNIGMIFVYADVPGQFQNIEFSPDAPQRFESRLELFCSQYPLVYLLKEQRRRKRKQPSGKIFDCASTAPHGYHMERIDDGMLDPSGKYGRVELFRIESRCAAEFDSSRIAKFVDRPPQVLKNGDFAVWNTKKTLSPPPESGNRFLAENLRPPLPDGWTIDFNNRRASDVVKWSFRRGSEGEGAWHFESPSGGFALRSQQLVPVGDYSLKLVADAMPEGKFLFFLYVYDGKRNFLLYQNAGVWQSRKAGRVLLTVPIKKDSFPAGAAFFSVGMIGWNGSFSLCKIDLSDNHPEKRP